MVERSDDLVLVAYAMARLGTPHEGKPDGPPAWLGTSIWRAAYDQFFPTLGKGREPKSFRGTLKNARDTFDPHVRSSRVGWLTEDGKRPEPTGWVKRALDRWGGLTDVELEQATLEIRSRGHRPNADRRAGTRSRARLPAEMLNRVTPGHVRAAVEALIVDPMAHAFGASTDFDLVTNGGVRLPPKAVFGLAASQALGFTVLPRHFSSGPDKPAFRILEEAGFRIEARGDDKAGANAGKEDAIGPIAMMADLAEIDEATEAWLEALEEGARAVGGTRQWLVAEAVMFRVSPSDRAGAWDTELGVSSTGRRWTVDLTAPLKALNANRLTTVATDQAGRRYLIRQGRLKPNPDSSGEIEGERFKSLSGLSPVAVSGGTTPKQRDWYIVAEIDASSEQIRSQTGAFVHACAQARLRSLGAVVPPAAPPLLVGGDEKGGTFFKKAIDAQPEKEVRRLQGEVWLALQAILENAEIKMHKPRHRAGYEVDGVILVQPAPILLEIKTGAFAADVYEGVGQLMLYAEMLRLKDHRRILLLPSKPSATLLGAAVACGIEIYDYELGQTEDQVLVAFPAEFLAACGVPEAQRPTRRSR